MSEAGKIERGAAQSGDPFRENESGLFRFIASRVGCQATAEDIRQDVFLRLRGVSWQAVVNPRAFLFRVAANLVSNHKLQARRRAELTDEVRELLLQDVDAATPERHALAAEELARVAYALQRLPARTQQIFVWSRFDGMTHTDIAHRLGISSQAVDKHFRKALVLLTDAAEDAE